MTASTTEAVRHHPHQRAANAGPLGLLFGAFVLSVFSPLLGWIGLIFAAVFLGRPYRRLRPLLGLGIVLSGALSYASRETSGLTNDDFYYTYYPLFLMIQQDGLVAFLKERYLDYGATIGVSMAEVGFYAWLWGVSFVFGKISIALLIFLTTFAIASLYWIWLERYFLPEVPLAQRSLAMALCLTLFSYGLCSQLSRQMFSIPFILAAVWEKRMARSSLWLFVGALFHLTALPIGVFGLVVRRWPGVCIAVLLGLLAVLFAWPPFLQTFGAAIAFDKFTFYSSSAAGEAAGFDSRYLVVGLAPGLLGCIVLANRRFVLGHLLIASALIYMLFLPLPLASYRATLFVTTALLGPAIVYALMDRVGQRIFALFCLAMALAMLARRAQLDEEGTGMSLWEKYPRADTMPFYYVPEICRIAR